MSSEEAPIQGFVFEATARAFASFDALTQAQQEDFDNKSKTGQTLQIAILDNSTRFNIWVGNIGARYPAADQRSADHRLRDAPRPASRILVVLQDLCETNHDLLEILLGHRQDAAHADVEDEELDPDDDGTFDLEVVEKPKSEAHELCLTVGDSITSLMKVSNLIRKATPRDKYAKAAAKKPMPEWTPSDRSHVGEKFPKVKDRWWLVERLGDAITARRQFLGYSQEHHERLAGGTGGEHNDSGRSAPTATAAVTATAASTLDSKMMQSRQLHQSNDDDDDSYSQAHSRVTYAAAVDSSLKFSSLELVAKGDSTFECPYCWSIVTCRKQRDWEVHMLEDLRAYVCTFAGCKAGPFGTRGSWFGHELEVHRRQWHCPSCPSSSNTLFHSANQLEGHLLSRHADRFSRAVVRSIVDLNSSPITEYAVHDACPFCDDLLHLTTHDTAGGNRDHMKVISETKIKEHIATHLEQLALFALPPTDEDIDDTDEDEDATRDTAPLPQQHADFLLWQQNVLSEGNDTAGQTSNLDLEEQQDESTGQWPDAPGAPPYIDHRRPQSTRRATSSHMLNSASSFHEDGHRVGTTKASSSTDGNDEHVVTAPPHSQETGPHTTDHVATPPMAGRRKDASSADSNTTTSSISSEVAAQERHARGSAHPFMPSTESATPRASNRPTDNVRPFVQHLDEHASLGQDHMPTIGPRTTDRDEIVQAGNRREEDDDNRDESEDDDDSDESEDTDDIYESYRKTTSAAAS
ncbi:hypothetical protein LTS10_005231 [Elasticomyces elasticus]|nr:hypothetical protein LTS10_005231 [Elasticomyces elasticus]